MMFLRGPNLGATAIEYGLIAAGYSLPAEPKTVTVQQSKRSVSTSQIPVIKRADKASASLRGIFDTPGVGTGIGILALLGVGWAAFSYFGKKGKRRR